MVKQIIKKKEEKLNKFESINNKGMRIKYKSFCIRISILILFLSSCKESPNIEIPNLRVEKVYLIEVYFIKTKLGNIFYTSSVLQ